MRKQSQQRSSDSAVANQYADTTYRVIGAAMRVHNELGPGYREAVYQAALSSAMRDAGLSFEAEHPVPVTIDGEQVGLFYLDHLVENAVIVEEKALPHLLTNEETAQVITYLKATSLPLALLLNFGRRKLEYKRILPPRSADEQPRAARYAWTPSPDEERERKPYPLIRSSSAANQPSPPAGSDPEVSSDQEHS